MTRTVRRHSRKQGSEMDSTKQGTMDDKYKRPSSTGHQYTGLKYLVEEFTLVSPEREVNKWGRGKRPDPRYKSTPTRSLGRELERATGQKVNRTSLSLLGSYFSKYVELVNLVLDRIYAFPGRLDTLGEELSSYRGQGYTLLKKEEYLAYKGNEDIKRQCFERMYRNVLEQAARITLSDWMRRQLMSSAIAHVSTDTDSLLQLLKNRYIPSKMIKEVRKRCNAIEDNGSGYYYTASVLRQLRKTLDQHILTELEQPLSYRSYQRKRVSNYLRDKSMSETVLRLAEGLLANFSTEGYPFSTPQMLSYTEDFSASTENSPGQGYWYSEDPEREDELFLFLKLPEPLRGTEHGASPYRTRTLAFRFLDWLPRAAEKDRGKAAVAEREGDRHRATRLRFRAMKFEDMHQQLMNTVGLQHATYQYARLKSRKEKDSEKMTELQEKITRLRKARKCGPPRLLLRGDRVVLQIPFLPPTREMTDAELGGTRTYSRRAGADRGVRVPVVLSTGDGNGGFVDEMISFGELLSKRDLLRQQTRGLTSQVKKMRNNWERKHPDRSPPAHLLKKERHLQAIWRKVRRLDGEIARQVASRTVWWCEEHGVRTLYFENLKNYSAPPGWGTLSWRLSSNLWSKFLSAVVYMRQSLGHKYGGVWTVSPAWTSQTCHVCGGRGVRVENEGSTEEKRGGEYFYCETCGVHIHADVNAARNIMCVQRPTAVGGRTA